MLIQLRRKIFPNNSGVGPAPFYAQVVRYNTDTRTLERSQEESLVNDPQELTKDALVDYYDYRPGRTMGVFYDGRGSIYTKKLAAGAGVNDVLVKVGLLPLYVSSSGAADACVDLTGQYGQAPYTCTLVGQSGAASGYQQIRVSPSELFPQRFYNLPAGNYAATITDALGHSASRLLTVGTGQGKGRAVLLREEANAVVTATLQLRYNEHDVVVYTYNPKPPATYQVPQGTLLDGYFLNATTWRRVYASAYAPGQPSALVYTVDQQLDSLSSLRLENLIYFNPDTAQEQNGAILVEVEATHGPLVYSLGLLGGGMAPVINSTGRFNGLPAGNYYVEIQDTLGKLLDVSVLLENRYGQRWQLAYSDHVNVPCRLELWTAGYTGTVTTIKGQADPVVLKSDGLSGSIGGQGDMGSVVATSLEMNLKATTEEFSELAAGDRYCRADFYYNNQLYFRGFVQAPTYSAPLLPGLQNVSLTATDGLADLKGTNMLGDTGQRLHGHWPLLNTLLHCLARTDVSLPVRLYTNRREVSMATTEAPELAATSNRTGYFENEKGEPLTQRQTIEAVAQALGGTLVQRAGAWEIRNILEAADDAPGRAYYPDGTLLGAVVAEAPTANVEPPTVGPLHWREESQHIDYRAGWKTLAGKTDVGWLKNSYVAGQVFSDKNAWLDDQSQLRPVAGWRPAPSTRFPLLFGQLGAKGTDYTTQWLRSAATSTWQQGQYLQGPALPLAPGLEAVPATLQITGRLVPAEYYLDGDGNQLAAPTNATSCVLPYEIVVDGQGAGVQLLTFELASGDTAQDSTVSVELPALPSSSGEAELRLYSWYAAPAGALDKAEVITIPKTYGKGQLVKDVGGSQLYIARVDGAPALAFAPANNDWPNYFTQLTATNDGLGKFYLSQAAVQLTPQNATWGGEDNFRAIGRKGSVQPTEPLEVFHADVPLQAGLRGGNLHAFARSVALADGTMSTSWRRALDLDAAPLFEANIYDGLALREGTSGLLTGELSHRGTTPPLLLDTFDLPYEVPSVAAHRFCVCATTWHTKHCWSDVSLVQCGPSAVAPNPYDFGGKVLVVDAIYAYAPGQYVPYALGCDDGSLLSWE